MSSLLVTSACEDPFALLFNFDRNLPVARGAIFGEIVRDEEGGDIAPYAQVSLVGAGLVRQADSEGRLAITDLGAGTFVLRIADDDDGDGQPERSRIVSATLAIVNKPDAVGFGGGPQLVSTSIGEVVVGGTGAVSGVVLVDDGTGTLVPPQDIGLAGRALLFRGVTTPQTGGQELVLGADAETHVDDTGEYRFNKVLSGDAKIVVTLHQASTLGGGVSTRGQTVFVSEPQSISIGAGETIVATQVDAPGFDPNLEDSGRDVEVLITPAFQERATPYAIFVPPGRTSSSCQATVPTATQFAYERIIPATVADISRLSNAPVGVWDVRLCGETQFLDAETGTLRDAVEVGTAQLFSLVVPVAPDGVATVLTGPVVLQRELDPCVRLACDDGGLTCEPNTRELIRDCDGDGRPGLTPFDASIPEVVAAWQTCASQCGATVGVDAAEAECTIAGATFDCDDDGDLQADTSEPAACYGPGLGDDRDGDGVCSGEDAFPTCAANTPQACAAGTVDVTPVIPAEFGSGEVRFDGGGDVIIDGGLGREDAGLALVDGGSFGEVDSGFIAPGLGFFDPTYFAQGVASHAQGAPVRFAGGVDQGAVTGQVVFGADLTVNAPGFSSFVAMFPGNASPIARGDLFPNQSANLRTMHVSTHLASTTAFVHYFAGQFRQDPAAGGFLCKKDFQAATLSPVANNGFGGDGCVVDPNPAAVDNENLSAIVEYDTFVTAAGISDLNLTEWSIRILEYDAATGAGPADLSLPLDAAAVFGGGTINDATVASMAYREVPGTAQQLLIVGIAIVDGVERSFYAVYDFIVPGNSLVQELPLSAEFTRAESHRITTLIDDPTSNVVIIVGTMDLGAGALVDEELFVWPVDMSVPINIGQLLPEQPTTTAAELVFVNDFLVSGSGTATLLGDTVNGTTILSEAWTLGGAPGTYTLTPFPTIGAEAALAGANSKILFGFQGVGGETFIGGKSNDIVNDLPDIWLGRVTTGVFE